MVVMVRLKSAKKNGHGTSQAIKKLAKTFPRPSALQSLLNQPPASQVVIPLVKILK
jgi:hypothetical protein